MSSVVEKLKPLLTGEVELSRLSRAARETIVRRFNMTAYIKKLERMYDEVAAAAKQN